jgi:hypothetical protein
MSLISIIEAYFAEIEQGISAESFSKFYTDDALQIDFPNLMVPNGLTQAVSELQYSTTKSKGVLSSQKVDILRYFEVGNTLIVEASWTGTLALPIGQIPIGGQMKASFARFYEFENGKIRRQRNYDCFDPF